VYVYVFVCSLTDVHKQMDNDRFRFVLTVRSVFLPALRVLRVECC